MYSAEEGDEEFDDNSEYSSAESANRSESDGRSSERSSRAEEKPKEKLRTISEREIQMPLTISDDAMGLVVGRMDGPLSKGRTDVTSASIPDTYKPCFPFNDQQRSTI